jgi:hypothetical protein
LLNHYGALADLFLSLWESHPNDEAYQKSALGMGKALQSFARLFPIGKSRAALCQGKIMYMNGKHEQAQKTWEQALPIARALALPYDTGLLHLTLGRYGEPTAREQHLKEALNTFTKIQAHYAISLVHDATQQA